MFAPTNLKTIPTLRIVRQMFAKRPTFNFKHLVTEDDLPCVRVTSTGGPVACQFDGDYLGVRETMTFNSVPDALAVAAPPQQKRR